MKLQCLIACKVALRFVAYIKTFYYLGYGKAH
jgi:hypothetical protein